MTAVNHMLMGAVIGAGFASPVVVPVALVSHYVLDMLPHYGIGKHVERLRDPVWKVDVVVVVALTTYLAFFAQLDFRAWTLVGAFMAVLPDFAWVYRFAVVEKFGSLPPKPPANVLNNFHANIQKHESPDRLWIEIVVFFGFLFLVMGTVVG